MAKTIEEQEYKRSKIETKGLKYNNTKREIEQKRRKEMIEEQMRKFGDQKLGVHGIDLPQFHKQNPSDAGDVKQYWKYSKSYTHLPTHTSRVEMLQNRKWWGKKEVLLVGDHCVEQNPHIDAFKACHVFKPKRADNYEKALTQNFLKDGGYKSNERRGNSHLRWSEVELKYNKTKGRLFEHVGAMKDISSDFDPMYSSFNVQR